MPEEFAARSMLMRPRLPYSQHLPNTYSKSLTACKISGLPATLSLASPNQRWRCLEGGVPMCTWRVTRKECAAMHNAGAVQCTVCTLQLQLISHRPEHGILWRQAHYACHSGTLQQGLRISRIDFLQDYHEPACRQFCAAPCIIAGSLQVVSLMPLWL